MLHLPRKKKPRAMWIT